MPYNDITCETMPSNTIWFQYATLWYILSGVTDYKIICERYRECFENIARQKMRQSDIRNNHALYLNGKRFSYKLEFCQNQMFYLLFY